MTDRLFDSGVLSVTRPSYRGAPSRVGEPVLSATEHRLLQTAAEVDELISDDDLNSAVDWFDGEPRMPTDEFLDRLFPKYGGLRDPEGRELDLDQLDNAAARRIMSRARALRRERDL